MARMLSAHFSLDELTFSQTAARRGIDNTPDAQVLRHLRALAATLEEVRSALGGVPILVNSGYRSPALNRAVGGARRSAHLRGLAADFTVPRYGSVLRTARAVAASGVPYDQLIFEYGRWVHLSIGLEAPADVQRAQTLSIIVAGRYETGLRKLA